MNQVEPKKDRVLKTLAVFGFVAVIILGVWLAVRIVSLMPQAFTSLASIADGVYSYQYQDTPELTVQTANSSVTAGEAFQVTWSPISLAGTYTFAYTCTDGVAVTLTDNADVTSEITCGEDFVIPEGSDGIILTIASERQRFTDVSYTIGFTPRGTEEAASVSSNTVTIINPSIPAADSVADAPAEEVEGAATSTEEVTTEEAEPTEESVATAEPEAPSIPAAPQFVETVILETPVSDPNGRIDLEVSLEGIGQLNRNGDFVRRNTIDNDGRAAFQFEVRNVGTKTSEEWDFLATLTSGSEYNAPAQMPLKPQERAVFTLGYDNVGENGVQQIGVRVRGGGDADFSNNRFTFNVAVVE